MYKNKGEDYLPRRRYLLSAIIKAAIAPIRLATEPISFAVTSNLSSFVAFFCFISCPPFSLIMRIL